MKQIRSFSLFLPAPTFNPLKVLKLIPPASKKSDQDTDSHTDDDEGFGRCNRGFSSSLLLVLPWWVIPDPSRTSAKHLPIGLNRQMVALPELKPCRIKQKLSLVAKGINTCSSSCGFESLHEALT